MYNNFKSKIRQLQYLKYKKSVMHDAVPPQPKKNCHINTNAQRKGEMEKKDFSLTLPFSLIFFCLCVLVAKKTSLK